MKKDDWYHKYGLGKGNQSIDEYGGRKIGLLTLIRVLIIIQIIQYKNICIRTRIILYQ